MRNHSPLVIVLVLWLAGLCAAAQFAKMGLVLPELQELYSTSGASAGFLITLISLAGALVGLITGMLVGNVGARNVLVAGLMLGSLMSAVQSFYLPIVILLVTRVIEGASHLAIVVAAPTLIAQYSSDRYRPAAMTLWGTFFGVSFAFTAWLGLPLVAEHGVHSLFLAHAVAVVAATVLVAFVVPKQPLSSNEDSAHTFSFSLAGIYKQHTHAWRSPYMAAPAAGWLFYTITFVALLAILPSLLPDDQRVFVAAVMPLASIASSMTIGVFLLWRFSAVNVINIGFVIAIVFAALLLFNPVTALICILLFSAMGLVQGASFAAIPQLNETASKQALAYGALAQAGNIGNLCGTPLLLLLLNLGGLPSVIVLVLACYSSAIIIHSRLSRLRRAEDSQLDN